LYRISLSQGGMRSWLSPKAWILLSVKQSWWDCLEYTNCFCGRCLPSYYLFCNNLRNKGKLSYLRTIQIAATHHLWDTCRHLHGKMKSASSFPSALVKLKLLKSNFVLVRYWVNTCSYHHFAAERCWNSPFRFEFFAFVNLWLNYIIRWGTLNGLTALFWNLTSTLVYVRG